MLTSEIVQALENVSSEIVKKIENDAPIFSMISKINSPNSGKLKLPIEHDLSTVRFRAEGEETDEYDIIFRHITLDAKRIATHIDIKNELLNDKDFDIIEYVKNTFARRFAVFLDRQLLIGNHELGGFQGLARLEEVVPAGDQISITELRTIHSRLPYCYLQNAVWIMSKFDYDALGNLDDGGGTKLLKGQFINGKTMFTLWGNLVLVNEILDRDTVFLADLDSTIAMMINKKLSFKVTEDPIRGVTTVYAEMFADAKLKNVHSTIKIGIKRLAAPPSKKARKSRSKNAKL